MEKNEVRKSLFVRIFEVIIKYVLRFRIPVLIVIAALTLFFAWQLKDLQIDAGIFSFTSDVPASEYVLTPAEAPEGEPLYYELPDEIKGIELPTYGYTYRDEDEKLHLAIPDEFLDGTEWEMLGMKLYFKQ